MRRLLACLLFAALLSAAISPLHASAQVDTAATVRNAISWLRAQQLADGSFPGFGPGDTADALVGIIAAGEDPAGFTKAGKTPLAYLQAQAATYAATGPGSAAKLVLAAVAAGADPTNFGGVNLVEQIGKSYDPSTSQYGPDVYGHTLALIAIKSVGAAPPPAAINRLISAQLEDGGWSFDGTKETGSDTNTTGLALQALAGQRQADGARAKAVAYLAAQQNDDGGFPYSQTSQFGHASDANSTALVIQGLLTASEDPAGSRWAKGKNSPQTFLVGLQNANGALRYQAALSDDNPLATYQAIPALVGAPLPIRTAQVAGAQDALSTARPADLPTTGAPAGPPAVALLLLALALLTSGYALRRAGS